MASYKITLSATNWTQTQAELYWDTVSQLFYADVDLTNEVANITPPTRECWQFDGFYSAASGGTQYIDPSGNFTDEFYTKAMSLTAALTINVHQTRISFKLTLNPNSGTTTLAAVYYRVDGGGYYVSDLCTGTPAHSVPRAVIANKAFKGYFNGTTTPGTQYIDKDGNFLPALDSLVLSAAKTIYAAFLAPFKVTVSANSGTGGFAAFYYDSINGLFYETTDVAVSPITRITLHTRETYKPLGYWSTNATTGVMRVSPDGTIAADFAPTAAVTIYAQWQRVSYKVTIGKQSGAGGTDALFYSNGVNAIAGWYFDHLCTQAAESVEMPTRAGYTPKGVFSATSGGTEYITRHGGFTDAFNTWGASLTAAKTIYTQWVAVYKITLDLRSGTGGTTEMWYYALDDKFYTTNALDVEATSVVPPTYECFRFLGFFSATSAGTQYITSAGSFTQALDDLAITTAKTFYAQWERVSWKLTFKENGGTLGETVAIYNDGTNANYYADDQCTTRITRVSMPTRVGYEPLGMYATATGGSKYINADGTIAAQVGVSGNTNIYARWTPRSYTLYFSEGSTASKTVTFGVAVGALPTPTRTQYDFVGWYVGETKITAAYVWNFDESKTAEAAWIPHVSEYFGNVTDYFGMASASLVPISSDSGDNKQRICVSNAQWSGGSQYGAGKFEPSVDAVGGVWRNPTVTYAVVRSFTFRASLGKAWAGSGSGSSQVSGYMLTGVDISTSIGSFPTITLTGTANEGRDAINKFDLSVAIVGRSKAQSLMGAVSGGGKLQSCVLSASCDPVVLAENMMPCASDVVHGKITVSAETINIANEGEPTAAGGFTSLGATCKTGDTTYKGFTFVAERVM